MLSPRETFEEDLLLSLFESRHGKAHSEFLSRSNTKQAVQPKMLARALKFRIKEVEVLYYLPVCSENKGVYQLHGYC